MAGHSNAGLSVAIIALAVFGTGTVVLRDWLVVLGWYNPYLWTFMLFFSQSIMMPISLCMSPKAKGSSEESESDIAAPCHFYMFVTALAYGSLVCMNLAYAALPGSILQMMKAGKLLAVALLSVFCLGKRLRSHQILGVNMTILGVGIVSFAALQGVGWPSAGVSPLIGLILASMACIGQAAQNVMEEHAMRKYKISPERLTGIEGVIGSVYALVALIVANWFHWENTYRAVHTMFQKEIVLVVFVLYLACIPPDKFAARAITAYDSAVSRALVEVGRTIAIWIIEMFCGWDHFSWVELLGYFVIASGTMVYGKILIVPFVSYVTEEPLLSKDMESAK